MDKINLPRILEALLFASNEPLTLAKLTEILTEDGMEASDVKEGLAVLNEQLRDRAVEVREVAGGYQLRTRPEMGEWLSRLEAAKPARFSRPAMETLAIVAYRQPATRAEVEEVRRVDCGGVMKSLLEKELVKVVGKKDVPGRPLLYGTTQNFLEVFGLQSLAQLPNLKDLDEILAEKGESLEQTESLGGKAEELAVAPETMENIPAGFENGFEAEAGRGIGEVDAS